MTTTDPYLAALDDARRAYEAKQAFEATPTLDDVADVERAYGIPAGSIKRVERLPGSDRLDVVVTDAGGIESRIRLSNDMAQRPGKFAQAIAVAAKVAPAKVSGDAWLAVRGVLTLAAVDVEAGEGETAVATVSAWLDKYLTERWPYPVDHDEGESRPFSYEGTAYLFLPDLLEWLRTWAPTTTEHLGDLLRRAGLAPCRPRIGAWRPRCWSIPPSMVPAEPGGSERTERAIERALDLLGAVAPWALAPEYRPTEGDRSNVVPLISTRSAAQSGAARVKVDHA